MSNKHHYRKMAATRELISRILELRKMLLSFPTGFNLVNAAVVCAVLDSISNEQHHNQIDYILVRKSFRLGVNIARTRVMTTFHLRLKRIIKPKHTRLKFDFEKLKDPNVLETFQAMIGGKFTSLTIMDNKDIDLDSMITTFNKTWAQL